jgi:hypothetical protein
MIVQYDIQLDKFIIFSDSKIELISDFRLDIKLTYEKCLSINIHDMDLINSILTRETLCSIFNKSNSDKNFMTSEQSNEISLILNKEKLIKLNNELQNSEKNNKIVISIDDSQLRNFDEIINIDSFYFSIEKKYS